MLKNVFTRAVGQGVQVRAAISRQLSSGGSLGVISKKFGGRMALLSPKGQLQVGAATPSLMQRLGGGVREAHDQRSNKGGDEELVGFLEEEIATEKKLARTSSIPATFEGYSIQVDKSEILLKKKVGNEEITISANINHSVDTDQLDDPTAKKQDNQDDMRATPSFDVEIKRGNQILCFNCSFVQNAAEGDGQDEFSDIFAIDEVTMYEGEWVDTDYAVAGDILDGYLYDLLMNLLEERGITNEFVAKFSDLCTDYEHKLYVELLVKLQNFLTKK